MEEAPGIGQHLLRLAGIQRIEDTGRTLAEHIGQRQAKRVGFANTQHVFGNPVQTDDALLVVDDHDRVFHVLKYSLVGQRRHFNQATADDQPGVDRQHRRQREGNERNRIGAVAEVIGERR